MPRPSRTSGLAIVGFVCSFFCGLLGLILSIMGRNECKRSGGTIGGEGLALAGIIISCISLALVPTLAVVAIPSLIHYVKKAKTSEAALHLHQLGASAQRVFAETGKFPSESAPLTPPEPCCGKPNNHCPAVPELYAGNPAWKALDFEVDAPSLFQYSYSGSPDGQSFVAKAVGDLDCDGTFITYELRGTAENGNLAVKLIEPPPNAD